MRLGAKVGFTFGGVFAACAVTVMLLTLTLSSSVQNILQVLMRAEPATVNLTKIRECHEQMQSLAQHALAEPTDCNNMPRLNNISNQLELALNEQLRLASSAHGRSKLAPGVYPDVLVELKERSAAAEELTATIIQLAQKDLPRAKALYAEKCQRLYGTLARVRSQIGAKLAYRQRRQLTELMLMVRSMNRHVTFVFVLALVGTLVTMIIISHHLIAQVNKFRRTAESFAKGDFSARAEARQNDEFQGLATALNNMAQKLQEQTIKMRHQAQIDELTHLVNRRKFYQILSDELRRVRRYHTPVSLVICDIDYFKQINDVCRHSFGDFVLRKVASILGTGIRDVDTVARYGGDEFMIIMPGTTSNDALQAAERLRAQFAETTITNGKHDIKVTASFGVAGIDSADAGSADSLVCLADEALYAAKRAGRNCTVRWEDISKEGLAEQEDTSEQVHLLQEEMAALSVKSQEALFQSVLGLAQAQEARDPYLAGHSRNVARCAVAIAKRMGFNDQRIENLRRAAMLHDIGKIGIPDRILHKPGPLDDNERAIIKQHPLTSVRILEGMTSLGPLLPFIRHHHERWDGYGYPDGLKGESIPLEARVLAVADAFDAITSNRPYRRKQTSDSALSHMLHGGGKQFDPAVLDVFAKWIMELDESDFAIDTELVYADTAEELE